MRHPVFYLPDSFSVPIYLLFKGDEGLRRNDIIEKRGMLGRRQNIGSLPEKSSDFP